MHEIIQSLLDIEPYLKALWGNEYGIYIADNEKYLCCDTGAVKIALNAGDAIKPGSGSHRALSSKSRIIAAIGPEVYGMPYTAVFIPLQSDSGDIIGSFGYVVPSRVEAIQASSKSIEASAVEIGTATEELSASAEQFAATTMDVSSQITEINKNVQSTDKVIELIHSISSTTQLLGLNARIEAARAGEAGRGFSVVAEEIQKMADSVKVAVKDVTENLRLIQASVKSMSTAVTEISAGAENQAHSTENIVSIIEKLHNLASDIQQQTALLIQ
ncbi:MAG: methyl-accepting chemotaxis protein [Peptococcaceae bacterium]|nr:methyl-accepting chemotaxis protein [Peptococcaceae bacterium]